MGEPKKLYWISKREGDWWSWGIEHSEEDGYPAEAWSMPQAEECTKAHRRAVLASTGMDPDALLALPELLRAPWANCLAMAKAETDPSAKVAFHSMRCAYELIARNLGINLEDDNG